MAPPELDFKSKEFELKDQRQSLKKLKDDTKYLTQFQNKMNDSQNQIQDTENYKQKSSFKAHDNTLNLTNLSNNEMFNRVNLISEGDERDMVQQMHNINDLNMFKKKEDIMSEPRKYP